MKTVAGILLVVSVLIMFFGCALDTSVPTAMGGRVNNIGLMNDQTNIMMVGGVLFLASIILFAMPRREKPASPELSNIDELQQLCALREKNLLTDEEFSLAKQRLLSKAKGEQ